MSAMADITVKTVAGKDAGTVALDEAIFAVQPNVSVMHQVVTAQLANRRAGTQSTKTRSEVRGGGAKPYRQKGTGRARQGSTNAPHFSGGGIALGPKPRSYRQRTPKKMIRLALHSALSDRTNEGKVVVIDSWGLDAPKTKDAAAAIAALGLEGRVLVVLDRNDTNAALSFRNLPDVQIIHTGELNAYDVLSNDYIVFTKATLARVNGSKAGPADATNAPSVSAGTAASVEAETGVASASEQPDASESSSEPADTASDEAEAAGGQSEAEAEPADDTEAPSVSAGTAASVEAETGVASASEQPDASESPSEPGEPS
jgi:large subunit ribosomal protein L4